MKKMLSLVLVLMFALGGAALAEEQITIGVLLSDTSNTFFVNNQNAIEAEAA